MGKSLRWSDKLYCCNPMHTIISHGRPVQITEFQFKAKHCRKGHEGDGGRCPYLFIDRKGAMKKK